MTVLSAATSADKLPLISHLLSRLSEGRVRYCHWKSNHRIAEFLSGAGDLDLLVARKHVDVFESILYELGFVRALPPSGQHHPSIEHFYGFDSATQRVVHVHAYYRLVTGGLLVKDFELPFADALLDGATVKQGIPLPDVGAECLVFLCRKLLEAASLTERLLLKRSWGQVQTEWRWLRSGGGCYHEVKLAARMTQVLHQHVPQLGAEWLVDGIRALDQGDWRLAAKTGRRLEQLLRRHRVVSKSGSRSRRAVRFLRRVAARVLRRPAKKRIHPRGAVVVVTGCDGAGKSTTVQHLAREFTAIWSCRTLHFGRPGIFALYRPSHRFGKRPLHARTQRSTARLLARCILAWERARAAKRAHRAAATGCLVIGDRFPTGVAGADGPTDPVTVESNWWNQLLLDWEKRLYASIRPPDLQIQLTAPVEALASRVRARGAGREAHDHEYFLGRFEEAVGAQAVSGVRLTCDATQAPEQVATDAMQAIFAVLNRRASGPQATLTPPAMPTAA